MSVEGVTIVTAILGISAYYHDAAAALVVDGEVVAAAQEERFSRRKHDASFPTAAVHYCLAEAGLEISQLDHVAFYEKPFRKFERLLESHLATAPRSWRAFLRAMPDWLTRKLYLSKEIHRQLKREYRHRLIFPEHHESHAAAAFFPSPFSEAALLTVDGVGEWATTTWGIGRGNRIELTHQIDFPHSLGLLYSAFTTFCGFRVHSGESKLMGLAPYGTPRFADRIREHLIDVRPDGSYRLNLEYFAYPWGLAMTTPAFERLFEGPGREPEAEITQREMDLAASIQRVTEDVLLIVARHVHSETGMKQLCLGGGVALNCVANGRLRREGPFDEIWVQPAAGDAGGALGAAWFVWHQLLDRPRTRAGEDILDDRQRGSLLGPSFGAETSLSDLVCEWSEHSHLFESESYADEAELWEAVAEELENQCVVGWFQGRMEFGPRALGNRSILADPRNPEMQDRINHQIKNRESFRPFAPIVLAERAGDYFELAEGVLSPYMLFAEFLRPEHRRSLDAADQSLVGLDRRRARRSDFPAVTHINHSARIQTVDERTSPRLAGLLRRFESRTGCPMLLNTSLNVRGEPIACNPADALRIFCETELDVLVLESTVLRKQGRAEGPRLQAPTLPAEMAAERGGESA